MRIRYGNGIHVHPRVPRGALYHDLYGVALICPVLPPALAKDRLGRLVPARVEVDGLYPRQRWA